MKLKSKLIATIVSITAAIAVMGVGVWAATQSFSVGVSNTVNLQFSSIAADVTVQARARADKAGVDASGQEKKSFTLNDGAGNIIFGYDSSAAAFAQKYLSINKDAGANVLQWEQADFLTAYDNGTKAGYITSQTKYALIDYIFTYSQHSGITEGSGFIAIQITETSLPSIENIIGVRYFVQVGSSSSWFEIDASDKVIAGEYNETIKVRAVCQYTNPALVSVSISDPWNFSVSFDATTDSNVNLGDREYTITETNIDNGQLLIEEA